MSTHYRTNASIQAPLDTVWEILTDVERMPEWTASMSSVRIVAGEAFAVGTRVEIHQPGMAAMTWTVEEITVKRHFRWSATSPGIVTIGEHWLEPGADDRQVQARFEIRHTGPLARVVGALTMRRTARYVDLELQGLAKASEAAFAADRL